MWLEVNICEVLSLIHLILGWRPLATHLLLPIVLSCQLSRVAVFAKAHHHHGRHRVLLDTTFLGNLGSDVAPPTRLTTQKPQAPLRLGATGVLAHLPCHDARANATLAVLLARHHPDRFGFRVLSRRLKFPLLVILHVNLTGVAGATADIAEHRIDTGLRHATFFRDPWGKVALDAKTSSTATETTSKPTIPPDVFAHVLMQDTGANGVAQNF